MKELRKRIEILEHRVAALERAATLTNPVERDNKYSRMATVIWEELERSGLRIMLSQYIEECLDELDDGVRYEKIEQEMILTIARKLYVWLEQGWDKPGWPTEQK